MTKLGGNRNGDPLTESTEPTPQNKIVLVPDLGSRSIKIWLSSTLQRPLTILFRIIVDTLMLLVGLALAGYLLLGGIQPDEVMRFAPILAVVWITVFVACGVYVRAQWPVNLGTLLGAVLSGMGLLAIAAIVYQESRLSLQEILLATLLIVLSECGLGSLQERASELLFRHRVESIPVLIIGELEERAGVRQAMEKNPGVYTCVSELNLSGGTIDLPLVRQTLDRTGAQSVILAARTERFPRVQFQDLLQSMRLHNVKVR